MDFSEDTFQNKHCKSTLNWLWGVKYSDDQEHTLSATEPDGKSYVVCPAESVVVIYSWWLLEGWSAGEQWQND